MGGSDAKGGRVEKREEPGRARSRGEGNTLQYGWKVDIPQIIRERWKVHAWDGERLPPAIRHES